MLIKAGAQRHVRAGVWSGCAGFPGWGQGRGRGDGCGGEARTLSTSEASRSSVESQHGKPNGVGSFLKWASSPAQSRLGKESSACAAALAASSFGISKSEQITRSVDIEKRSWSETVTAAAPSAVWRAWGRGGRRGRRARAHVGTRVGRDNLRLAERGSCEARAPAAGRARAPTPQSGQKALMPAI